MLGTGIGRDINLTDVPWRGIDNSQLKQVAVKSAVGPPPYSSGPYLSAPSMCNRMFQTAIPRALPPWWTPDVHRRCAIERVPVLGQSTGQAGSSYVPLADSRGGQLDDEIHMARCS
jgi:hypothetical protein